MRKYILFLLISISLILTACGSGGNCNNQNCSGRPVQIGTLPNGSAVYLSQNNLPVSEGNAAQATIYLEGGSHNESYNISFATSQQQSTSPSTTEGPYGINISTAPTPCIIGTIGSGASTQCQITISSSANTADGTYLITPTAIHISSDASTTVLNPLTILVSGPITPTTKAITSFSLNGVGGLITENNITVTMPYGTPVTSLIATFTTTGTSVTVGTTPQVSTVTPNDFTNPVSYTVTAADGSTNNYTVTVTISSGPATASITLTPSTANPNLIPGAYFTVNATLTGGDASSQVLTLNNRSALQAIGVLVVSNQTNLNGCTLNSTTTSCTFNVIISAPTQVNATPPALNFVNSGNATVTSSTISYGIIPPVNVTRAIQLPQTGQTTIYTAYDDANFLMGYPWVNNAAQATTPTTRFTDDGCEITDHLTGLIWLKNPASASATTLNWNNSLTTANTGTWCGQSAGAWHVPNVNELFSIMNLGESNIADWLDGSNGRTCAGSCFNAIESTYWSSSIRSNDTTKAWYITMATGRINSDTRTTAYYWLLPVRGTSTGLSSISKTGESQTVPLNPAPVGSDGNLMKGTAWPNPRFTVAGDCITDNLTGLTWLRDASLANNGATLKWESAINLASIGTWCGYTDWRMPNQIEMLSLVNYGQQFVQWLIDAGFLNLSSNQYWSSTTTAQDKSKAWAATLRQGGTNTYGKSTTSASLLPVRGGVNP